MIMLLTCENPATWAGSVGSWVIALLGARRHSVRRERTLHRRVLMADLTWAHLAGAVVHPHLIDENAADELCGHRVHGLPGPVGGLPQVLLARGQNVDVEHHAPLALAVAAAHAAGQQHHRPGFQLILQPGAVREPGHDPHPLQALGEVVTHRTYQVRCGRHTSATLRRIVSASVASSPSTGARTCASGRPSLSRTCSTTRGRSVRPEPSAALEARDAIPSASVRIGPVTSSERITSPMPSKKASKRTLTMVITPGSLEGTRRCDQSARSPTGAPPDAHAPQHEYARRSDCGTPQRPTRSGRGTHGCTAGSGPGSGHGWWFGFRWCPPSASTPRTVPPAARRRRRCRTRRYRLPHGARG